ncbi:MAG TPA: replication-associated recombination protein A [Firmicutes bacterium]|nr:replication-associated recombination protein A [Bacillota bacterium]
MSRPLADTVRPNSFDDMVGQEKLVGKNGILRRMVESGRITNMIFFGPPGTGKTTAANIVAEASGMTLRRLNATTAGLDDVRRVIDETSTLLGSGGILLYLDEIQYFNKKQQQSLLEYIEDGRITLIASTTENPYFSVYNAIISRSAVFEFTAVSPSDIKRALIRAFERLNTDNVTLEPDALELMSQLGAGDVRRALGILESAYSLAAYSSYDMPDSIAESDSELNNGRKITRELVDSLTPKVLGSFDRAGDVHYDLLSCLQKSIRGSDPDAAVFYTAKLLGGGDLLSVCRRLQVIAYEDIGLAYPLAGVVVRACVESARELGLPEARLPLAEAAVLLATAPKSNSAHDAINAAAADIAAGKGQTVPTHLRSPKFVGYKYPHDYPNHWVKQQYLPDDLVGAHYYEYGPNKTEQASKQYWEKIKEEPKP